MAVEYDLVIIGNTLTAHIAAASAVKYQARVALVLPKTPTHLHLHLYPHALHQASLTPQHHQQSHYPWQYAQTVVNQMATHSAPALLAAQGVDIINGTGEFVRKPTLAFKTKRRSLVAKRYLLAMGAQPEPTQIEGLAAIGYVTLATLSQVTKRSTIPQRWAIIGDEAIGVELAQSLCRLGYQVTLLVTTAQILPEEDVDTVAVIQSHLEAAGVVLITQAVIASAGVQGTDKYLVVNRQTIYVDEIFVAAPEQPLVESFNLRGVGIEHDRKGVLVDNKLRTSNGRILACGSVCGKVFGGYYGEHLAEYEAKLAVNNALSRRSQDVYYYKLPWVVFSNPQLARIGPTEIDARLQFQRRFTVLRSKYQDNPKALIAETDTGFIKILVRRSGQIVGATIVGQEAAELMQIIALAMHHRLSIIDLRELLGIELTYTHLVVAAARQWRPPAKWLQIIDPLLQGWADQCRKISSFFDSLKFRPQHPKKLDVSSSKFK